LKTLLTILCILLLFFCLLNLLRLRISLEYDEGGAHVTLFLGRVPILKLPGEKKTSAEKKGRKKKRKRKKEAPEGKSKGGSVPGFHALLKIIADVLGKLKRRLIVEELTLWYRSANDDPAAAALGYGRASAAAAALLEPLTALFRIQNTDFRTAVDFMETKPRVYARLIIAAPVGALIWIGLRALRLYKRARRAGARKDTEGSK
jgi:hypothetical protein